MLRVGIAMIQGARHEHAQAVHSAAEQLGVECDIVYLREKSDLDDGIDCLILPGGESTTMRHVSTNHQVFSAIFGWICKNRDKKVLGTCAGAILLTSPSEGFEPFIQARISRNAWGRQRMSFEAEVDVTLDVQKGVKSSSNLSQAPLDKDEHRPLLVNNEEYTSTDDKFNGVFIRAPRFENESVKDSIVAKLGDEVVGVKSDNIVALTFHPELTGNTLFHRWLLQNDS